MRRAILSILLLVGISTALPANAGFLPDCDQTVYNIQRKNPSVQIIYYKITPERFEEKYPPNERGNIAVEITVNRACGIDDFIQLFINLANWGLSILAIIATLLYIWGGFSFLIAGGREEHIKEGKEIIVGTSTGILVVLTAYLLVTFWSFASLGQGYAFAPESGISRSIFGQGLSCLSTYKEICKTDSGAPISKDTTLHQGCGDKETKDIVSIQQKLVDRKCLTPDRTTGCYDSVTQDAVFKFQIAGGNSEIIRQAILITPGAGGGDQTMIQGSVDYATRQVLFDLNPVTTNCE